MKVCKNCVLNYRAISFILFVVVITLTFSCAKKEPGVIKIGAILPLTGNAGVYGQWAKNGIDLAVEENNSTDKMNNNKIEIIYEDDQCNPKLGVSAFNKLCEVDKVKVVLGALCSSSTLAIVPIANEKKIILFSPGSSSPKLTKAGPFFFRNWPSDTYEGKTMSQFAYESLRLRSIAVLFINNDYGLGLKDVFVSSYESLGGVITLIESYEQGSSDFRTQISKIDTSNTDGIYIPGHTNELGLIVKQLFEMRRKLVVLSVVGFESPVTLQVAGSTAEGVYYTAPLFDPLKDSDIIKRFVKSYESKYGVYPENFAAHAYDALNIIATAIKKSGYSPDKIRQQLIELKNYPGVSGETSFDVNGDVKKQIMIKTVKNGKYIIFR